MEDSTITVEPGRFRAVYIEFSPGVLESVPLHKLIWGTDVWI